MPDRIGVFVCWCGANIASTVKIEEVIEQVKQLPGVALAKDYMYMCSDPGQQLVRDSIVSDKLNGVIVASCSPRMHEATFRKAADSVGLNPYLVEIANIREQCSWVHQNEPETATAKAVNIIEAALEKVRVNRALVPIEVSLNKRTLIVGGGIAGITAACDLTGAGYEVVLVEKGPALGGKLLKLHRSYPYLIDPKIYAAEKAGQLIGHSKATVYLQSEVKNLEGYVGNFTVNIDKKPPYINDRCNFCGRCIEVCPVSVPDGFNENVNNRKAIHYYAEHAVPKLIRIDPDACLHFKDGSCSACKEACEQDAVDFGMEKETIEEHVGSIILATGYRLYENSNFKEYGGGELPDVIDALTFERMLDDGGPTDGKVVRPSTGEEVKSVLWVQCAGSRDPEFHKPYCSRACCNYTIKQARLFKDKYPKSAAYISYMDIRTDSKGCEEFYQETQEEQRIVYVRGRVSKIYRRDNKLAVSIVDTLSRLALEIETDLVVLANAMVPAEGIEELAGLVRATIDGYGFLTETHIKLYPVESSTKGVFLAGCAQSPKDITDSVSQALAATGKIMTTYAKDTLLQDPLVAEVDRLVCSGCGICVEACPYGAREVNEYSGIAEVNRALCEGCGACVAACPNKACELINQTSIQNLQMIEVFQQEG